MNVFVILGWYFGLVLDRRTDFPYSFLNHPMYIASTLDHLGLSLMYVKSVF